jgi:hypothetical protein
MSVFGQNETWKESDKETEEEQKRGKSTQARTTQDL